MEVSDVKTFTAEKPNIFYYVTSVTYNRVPVFRRQEACKTLIEVFEEVRSRFPYKLVAYVIMLDHFHFVVNPIDGDISKLLLRIRGNAARRLIDSFVSNNDTALLRRLALSSRQKGNHQYSVWQKNPLVVNLESNKFILQKTGYIHNNPVRARLVDHPAKWKWSSYHALLPHEQSDVPIEMDKCPYWTDEELANHQYDVQRRATARLRGQ
jgi:putative transposase